MATFGNIKENSFTKLAVFDLDGTLINSPLPETGKEQYKQKTGQHWPHKGWWSKRESLDTKIFEIKTIPAVINDYNKVIADDGTLVVMMTGRITPLGKQVKAILDAHGLTFDGYFFNDGGETCEFKMREMEKLLQAFPSIRELAIWDDRVLHIERFEVWGKTLGLDKFSITVVPGGNHTPSTTEQSQ